MVLLSERITSKSVSLASDARLKVLQTMFMFIAFMAIQKRDILKRDRYTIEPVNLESVLAVV